MGKPFVLFLNEIEAISPSLTGGKGAHLAEMKQRGFPVPPGFCVTTHVWDGLLSDSEINEQIAALEDLREKPGKIQPDLVRNLSAEIRKKIENSSMDQKLEREILKAWSELGEKGAYAVRSSSMAEDLAGYSFAGQQDTYLNIIGKNALVTHIKKCWASLFTERAVLYRMRNGFDQTGIRLAVVVQKMVNAEASGVAFTANPLSGSRDEMVIDAGFGLGEALVSGLINPDHYCLDKKDGTLLSVSLSKKEKMIKTARDGGTVEISLTGEAAKRQVLRPDQIQALYTLAIKVERYYKSPQDLEWAFRGEELFLLQARPITTLFPRPESPRHRGRAGVFISLGHIQVMTAPLSPMGGSLFNLLLPFGNPKRKDGYNPYIVRVGGRLYTDISRLLTIPIVRKRYPRVMKKIDPLIGSILENIVGDKKRIKALLKQEKRMTLFGFLREIAFVFPSLISGLMQKDPRRIARLIDTRLNTWWNRVNEGLERRESLRERIIYLRSMWKNLLYDMLSIIGLALKGLMNIGRIPRKIKEWVPAQDLSKELVDIERGLEGNVTTTMDLEMGDLADCLISRPELLRFLESVLHGEANLNEGRGIFGSEEFFEHWDRFMEKYGMRGPGEIDIAAPRWKENPRPLLQILAGRIRGAKAGSHRLYYEKMKHKALESREKLIRAVQDACPGRKGKRRARKIEQWIDLYRTLMPYREHGKYYIVRVLDLLKNEILKASRQYQLGDLVWQMEIGELSDVVAGSTQADSVLLKKLEQRRAQTESFKKTEAPRVILGDGTIPRVLSSSEGFPSGALIGAAVSAGVAEGPARVIKDPSEEPLLQGEILVAPFTDPAWTPLFLNAVAVVIEVGGMMTHGSVIAREYGIPAVVSVPGATDKIKTGQRLRVNGNAGYVEVLESPKTDVKE